MALKQTAVALLLLALAGCASVDVQQPAVATSAYSAAFMEAQSLAQGHAALTGPARSANAARIEALLAGFPFRILGFHADNGSEYINHKVARMLDKLSAEFTKSRPRHSNEREACPRGTMGWPKPRTGR